VTTGIRTFPDRHDRLLPSCQAQSWLKSGEKWARSAPRTAGYLFTSSWALLAYLPR
jgi:hypothetical protein